MTNDRIIDIFEDHGQCVTPRDCALIRAIAEAVAPQRTWVGLTDEEVIQIRDDMTLDIRSHVDFYRHCEAKLKEKNT